MGIVNKILPHYTYEDYVHWEGRWELIYGHPIAMSPLPVPKHQRAAANILFEIESALRNSCRKRCKAYMPLDYMVANDTIVQPDVLVVCNSISKKYLDFPPALVVEVLSPSTALKDRNTKFEIYQNQKVKYYLIVDADKQLIEIYEMVNDEYQLQPYTNGFLFKLTDECSVAPQLDKIWEE